MSVSELIQRNYSANIDQLAKEFADFAEATLQDALSKNQKATLVVPGGNTPRYFLPALANCVLPWERVTITLSDERWVDTNSNESNQNLVTNHLLSHLPESANFSGLKTHHTTPFEAVHEIHQRLDNIPQPFTLTILGLGEDGHIASLFPGMTPADQATTQHCIAVDQPTAPSPRISLSLTALANSQHITLVVISKTKRQLLDRLNKYPDPQIPLIWLLRQRQIPITIFETDSL